MPIERVYSNNNQDELDANQLLCPPRPRHVTTVVPADPTGLVNLLFHDLGAGNEISDVFAAVLRNVMTGSNQLCAAIFTNAPPAVVLTGAGSGAEGQTAIQNWIDGVYSAVVFTILQQANTGNIERVVWPMSVKDGAMNPCSFRYIYLAHDGTDVMPHLLIDLHHLKPRATPLGEMPGVSVIAIEAYAP